MQTFKEMLIEDNQNSTNEDILTVALGMGVWKIANIVGVMGLNAYKMYKVQKAKTAVKDADKYLSKKEAKLLRASYSTVDQSYETPVKRKEAYKSIGEILEKIKDLKDKEKEKNV